MWPGHITPGVVSDTPVASMDVVPTVLAGITEDMDIASVETFGPVACVT
ncbi:MAG TPA: aldehyde dehydrogenase family protein, partial [Dehalococcoidia bacterium]|nr:aldehyde dehydrogenase family protein [Dehalococcoidia bacterium]